MDAVLGLALGAGLFLVWWSWWEEPPRERVTAAWVLRLRDRLVLAGIEGVSPSAFIAVAVGFAVAVLALAAAVTGSLAVAACFALMAGWAPFAVVASRARSRQARLRHDWPEVVDALASGVRAGLSLPEAVARLGERGPEDLRPAFAAFAEDYRATGRFDQALDALKDRLADPVADRLVEALRLARDVGGGEVGTLLRSLSRFLRDDARTRGELEARQSWTVNAARLAVAAPWAVLAMLSLQPTGAAPFDTPAGMVVLAVGGAATVGAYRLMRRLGRLPLDERVMR